MSPTFSSNNAKDGDYGDLAFNCIRVLLFSGFLIGIYIVRTIPNKTTNRKRVIGYSALLFLTSTALFLVLMKSMTVAGSISNEILCALRFSSFFMAEMGAGAFIFGLYLMGNEPKQIKVGDLSRKPKKKADLLNLLRKSEGSPIGQSLLSDRAVLLPTNRRIEHLCCVGSSGMGKTTLMFCLQASDIQAGRPVIVIDPKGELTDIQKFVNLARAHGKKDEDIKIFSIGHQQFSNHYNPLKNGTPEQIKSKLLDALQLKHEFYGAQASLFLGAIISALLLNSEDVSLSRIFELTVQKAKLHELIENLKSREVTSESERVLGKVMRASQIKGKDLEGLIAQLSILNCEEFYEKVNPAKGSKDLELDLQEIISKGQVVYFALNKNGYGDFSDRFAKLLLQDIKVLSNRIQAGSIEFRNSFISVYVDEFGAYATPDFADFLKMTRSARIAVNMFFQGLADLRTVSQEFEEQVVQNTSFKVIFRSDIQHDVETWAGLSGSLEKTKQSRQIRDNGFEQEETGMGTKSKMREMRIDFDVLRHLPRGKALLINKSKSESDVDPQTSIDLFQVWNYRDEIKFEPQEQQQLAVKTHECKPTEFIKTALGNTKTVTSLFE